MIFTEDKLKKFAAPLSDTEIEKCKHAIEEVRDALKDLGYSDNSYPVHILEEGTLSYAITMKSQNSPEKINIFVQGSYANNTCVKAESDVDIAVIREDVYDYAFGKPFRSSLVENNDEAKSLKNTAERALKNKFPMQVHRGNKSIKVSGNTYRKNVDAVPSISVHYYFNSNQKDFETFVEGMNIYADDGSVTTNFPKQHIANGKSKNVQTNYYYKKMVRIIKKMRILMSDDGFECANDISSFGLESLLWNLPDKCFTKYSMYGFIFENIIDYLENESILGNYYEVNGIKKLCPSYQDQEKYKCFINNLSRFFEYDY